MKAASASENSNRLQGATVQKTAIFILPTKNVKSHPYVSLMYYIHSTQYVYILLHLKERLSASYRGKSQSYFQIAKDFNKSESLCLK